MSFVWTPLVDGVPGVGTEILAGPINNLAAKVGDDASVVATSLDYLLKNPASIEPGHKHSSLWASDGSVQPVAVDSSGLVKITAPAANLSALLLDDGLGTLGYLGVGGYGALLTLNVRDFTNDYQLSYINEEYGKIANYQSGDNSLEFDHLDINNNYQGYNYLLACGGLSFNGPGEYVKGIYNLSAKQIGIGRLDDFANPGSNVPGITIQLDKMVVGINTATPIISDGAGLHVAGKILRLDTTKTPATSGAAGNKGEICWDASYIYVAVDTNTWKRAALSTW